MRVRAVILAAALMLAPLGARAADLVVWWEEGFNPGEDEAVREIVAAFEQKTGKTGRAGLLSRRTCCRRRLRRRSRPGHRPTSCSASHQLTTMRQWAHEGRLVDLSERARAAGGPVRSGRARPRPRCSTRHGPARPLRPADGPHHEPRPRLEEPARAGRLHARRHPEGVGGVLVLLVRQGPAGRAQGDRARRHLRRRPVDVGCEATPTPMFVAVRGGLRAPTT